MIKFVWLGTASVRLDIDGEILMFDPFFPVNKKIYTPLLEDFSCADFFFNSHPHFDHLFYAPQILKNSNAKMYGTQTMCNFLTLNNISEEKFEKVSDGDIVNTKNSSISIFNAKHCKNDFGTLFGVVMRVLLQKPKTGLKILKIHKSMPLNNDIIGFEISANNKNIILLGSAGLNFDWNPKKDVDVLIWPFQGRRRFEKYSLKFVEKIKPKKIVLDHFDNSFPPFTHTVKTDNFVKIMKKLYPEIEVIVPELKQEIEL